MKVEKPKVSKIEINLNIKEGTIDSITNDSSIPMHTITRGGLFVMSNYPLTIECNSCNGKGKVGLIKPVECNECKGLGQVDLYHKK